MQQTHVMEATAIHDNAVVELHEAQADFQRAQERLWKAEAESARTAVNITWAYRDDAAPRIAGLLD